MAAERRRRPSVRPARAARPTRAGPSSPSATSRFKVEILDDLAAQVGARRRRRCRRRRFYEHGPFIDLCKGPHVASTGKIGPFKLLAVAGAYWRGDEKRPMLQRIYGTVWATQEELDQYLWRREEAKKRDHRRLGVQLDLFSFHDVSARVRPSGTRRASSSGGRSRARCASSRSGAATRRSARRSSSASGSGEQSGHWDLYRDNMFLLESEGQTFSLKPMNCPESTFIYRSRTCAPIATCRCATTSTAGSTATSARARCQRADPRPPVHPGRRAPVRPAGPARWTRSRRCSARCARPTAGSASSRASRSRPSPTRRSATRRSGSAPSSSSARPSTAADISYTLKPKDGTFYAPKIDIYIDDALGREWQMATIQVDLVMLPERFDLTYIDENGQPQRPIAIHRAIYGSLERFIGILVEHFAGAFPLWLAPVQAVVIPIADRHADAAEEFAGVLARARPARRGRRVRQPDAEQDPAGAGAEGAVHGGAGRPRDRGADGVAPHPRRASSSRPRTGRRSPTGLPRRVGRAGQI